MSVDQSHEIDLLLHVGDHVLLRQPEPAQHSLPACNGRALRIMLLRLGDARRSLSLGRMLEEGRLHLLAQQFLIDQAVEHGPSLVIIEVAERPSVEQRLVA